MKKFVLPAACGFLAGSSFAQSATLPVPPHVLLAFRRAQPLAGHVAWHRCLVGYEAAFEQQPAGRLPGERRLRGQSSFTPNGELVESRLDVPYQAFPPLGRTALSARFPHYQPDRIVRIATAAGTTSYLVDVCRGKDRNGKDKHCQTAYFDADGRPLPGALR